MKTFVRDEFSTANVASMEPGESIIVTCRNARDVQNVRLIAAQFKRLYEPKNIARYASQAKQNEDGTISLELTAVTE